MELKATLAERLNYESLFPKETNLITMTLMKDIRKKMEIPQEEMTSIDMMVSPDGKQFMWDQKKLDELKIDEKTFDLTKAEVDFLKERITELDNQKKIDVNLFEFCLRVQALTEIKEDKKE